MVTRSPSCWFSDFMDHYDAVASSSNWKKCYKREPWRSKVDTLRRAEERLDVWRACMDSLATNEFYGGQNGRGWRLSMEYLCRPTKRAAFIDMGYEWLDTEAFRQQRQAQMEARAAAQQKQAESLRRGS